MFSYSSSLARWWAWMASSTARGWSSNSSATAANSSSVGSNRPIQAKLSSLLRPASSASVSSREPGRRTPLSYTAQSMITGVILTQDGRMERASYLESLRRDAADLFSAARPALAADVPTCPGWTVERLVGHVGRVYRWTAGWITTGAAVEVERPPTGDAVVTWARAGLYELVAVLDTGDSGAGGGPGGPAMVATWAGQQPAIFWPRRMAIETALHRWDAQAARGDAAPASGSSPSAARALPSSTPTRRVTWPCAPPHPSCSCCSGTGSGPSGARCSAMRACSSAGERRSPCSQRAGDAAAQRHRLAGAVPPLPSMRNVSAA